jgi:two-component system, LytTR family, response regulator LytT
MKAVIVEDELVAAQKLQRLITQTSGDIQVAAILQSIDESIEWFSLNDQPDLVFMDIHLADGSAFTIFEKVKITCPVIFTTAYDEYALKAFEVNSIDYLLKPINEKSFDRAITKFRNMTAARTTNNFMIPDILAAFREARTVYKSNFLIPHKDKFIPLSIDKIACFYSENKMAKIFTVDHQTYNMDTSLEDIFMKLDPLKFFRANRQYIVSHEAIKDLSVWFGSKLSINLTIEVPEKIIVSKARVPEFKAWYTK